MVTAALFLISYLYLYMYVASGGLGYSVEIGQQSRPKSRQPADNQARCPGRSMDDRRDPKMDALLDREPAADSPGTQPIIRATTRRNPSKGCNRPVKPHSKGIKFNSNLSINHKRRNHGGSSTEETERVTGLFGKRDNGMNESMA